jgi:hypothetical protein
MSIHPFLHGVVFEPSAIQAMSMAFDDVCATLNVPLRDNRAREVIATRIIDSAARGGHSPTQLRDGVLKEAYAANPLGI